MVGMGLIHLGARGENGAQDGGETQKFHDRGGQRICPDNITAALYGVKGLAV
jgi:hypothetical protein